MLSSNTESAQPQVHTVDRFVDQHVALASATRPITNTLSRPKFLQVAWLGQTMASLCWIVSVFCYGISSIGDGLQLAAASAWFIANIADLVSNDHQ